MPERISGVNRITGQLREEILVKPGQNTMFVRR